MSKPSILTKPTNVTLTLDEESVGHLLTLARADGSNMSAVARRIIKAHRDFFSPQLDQSTDLTKDENAEPVAA